MRRVQKRIGHWSLRILCAVALLFSGLAFQPASASDIPFAAELAQLRLPDGTLPIICVTYTDVDGKAHGKTLSPGCGTCHMVAVVIVPAPTDLSEQVAFDRHELPLPHAEAFYRQLYPPNTGPTGPPFPASVG